MLVRALANPANDRVAVLFIDLDDFKIVNDSLGHAAGDELLRVVADRLRSVARDGETVARLGGDEFAITLASGAGSAGAVAVARRTLAVLAYQPVIEIDTRALLGFEALIRWQHPTRGLLQPAQFIDLAEDTGDIVAICQWVVDEACGALAQHHRQHTLDERQLWMSVNVSPIEITQKGFTAGVYQTLERHGIAQDTLIIEITEGVAMTDTGTAIAVLNDLRAAGVHIALDDFGTGFSSLRSLHELPIDVIKIDRSFLVNNGDDQSLLEAILTFGRGLGLDIIAEGIETSADLARLTQFGIAGQGYLFGQPLSAAAADDFRRGATTPVLS